MSTLRFNFPEFCERSGSDTADLMRILGKVQNGAWCAGGAIRGTLIRQSLDSDFDFFFRDADHLAEWEKNLPDTLKLVRETEHHKHWRGTIEGSDLPIDIQAIRFRFYASAEEVIDSFDYTITQFALDGEELVTTPYALWDLGRKKLAIHKVTYPVATMRRMLKYTQQGFTACAGCMAQLLRDTATSPQAMAELEIAYVD
ncbi:MULTISPECIES: hypothetical protein [Chelativorans]|uniref:hypothetical protein n=1 Tax=Chelativorans TaxID=449972 RepID=UPI0002DD929D|nr:MULTISPECIES: hypothetical protein [Chelativorans]